MQNLQPEFVLVGSIQEGSRLGIGNEIDLTIHFKGWKQPFVIHDDAFHLKKAKTCPEWMDSYFDHKDQFLFSLFMENICQAIDDSLNMIFTEKRNPQKLLQVKTNEDYFQNPCGACEEKNKETAKEAIIVWI